ncbi:MAG TPA: acyl-ACP--UDP-N-acetylglucosamine O-acyltransferase [Verrucomicrobiae bacterium]|nr:acyl-ACP--UDP-N-acetylglucosamine O-acyltransferase [Verrucomicrobiae bacterium]
MTERIHPSAIVDARATLGDGVTVGAFSVIGPEVTLGAGVAVGHHAVLEGLVVVEAAASIGHGAVVGGAPQDLKYKPGTPSGVRIGPRTVVREHVTIHRATTPEGWTEVGADCLLMATSHVAHDCRLGDEVVLINYAGITGHCEIGPRVTVGGYSALVPFTRVGRNAYIGGCSKVVADVPPFMLVDGTPATARGVNVVGLRRSGMPADQRRRLQEAYRLLYRSGLAPRTAVERIRRELPAGEPLDTLLDFIAAARRGICGPPRRMVDDSAAGGADAAESAADAAEGGADSAERGAELLS